MTKLERMKELLAGIHERSHARYDHLRFDILDQILRMQLGRQTLPW